MILGIDASNIRARGGITHLTEVLGAADPRQHGVDQIIIWGRAATLSKIKDREWLCKRHVPVLEGSLVFRALWQRFRLKKVAEEAGCDLLFVPGGSSVSSFKPVVTMSQNLLPFESQEIRRYGKSLLILKILLLRLVQIRSFRKSGGVIFLTQYARDVVLKVTGKLAGKTVIIPHGIDPRFFCAPRRQRQPNEFSHEQPCRVLYVSVVEMYKHQWHLAEAVAQLRADGMPVVMDFVGPPGPGMARLRDTLRRVDPLGSFVNYWGAVPYEKLHEIYTRADIGVFASSCENMPNILLEAMASGLPIGCSRRGPMPEVLGDAGVYFDPENPDEIAHALRELIDSPELRRKLAKAAFERVQAYSWQRCARETLGLLAEVARAHGDKPSSARHS